MYQYIRAYFQQIDLIHLDLYIYIHIFISIYILYLSIANSQHFLDIPQNTGNGPQSLTTPLSIPAYNSTIQNNIFI